MPSRRVVIVLLVTSTVLSIMGLFDLSPPGPDRRYLAGPSTDDHNSTSADDHHGDDEGIHGEVGHEISLFNTLGKIKAETAMVAIIIIVAAVLTLESIFHLLNEVTHETSFHKMVLAVEKELMLVGCTAFIFKIIVNSPQITIEHKWLVALEYADLLVPIFAFANCFIGTMLILLALRQCRVWSKGFHLTLSAVLGDFEAQCNTQLYRWSLKPLNAVISEMEFRIFHGIFCENFKVQRAAFAFDSYVEIVLEKFILEIIKIKPINWILVILLLLLNMGRTNSGLAFFYCGPEDYLCIQRSAAIVFTLAGAVMLLVTVFVSVISRRYEILIIRKSGVSSIDKYPDYLMMMEAHSDVRHEATRLDKDEFKMAVTASVQREKERAHRQSHFMDLVMSPSQLLHSTAENNGGGSRRPSHRRKNIVGATEEEVHEKEVKLKPQMAPIREGSPREEAPSKYQPTAVVPLADEHLVAAVHPEGEQKADQEAEKLTDLSKVPPEGEPLLVAPAAVSHGEPELGVGPENFPVQDLSASSRRYTSYKLNRLVPVTASQAANFLESIFLFSSPRLYFETVRLLIMLIALYMALWVLNFLGSDINPGWKFLTILPALLSAVNYFYIVKTSSLLKAIYQIDNEAVLEVLENTESSRQLADTIRETLVKKLHIMGDPRVQLRNLFNEIDDNFSGRLSRKEFEQMLKQMDIHFSRKKWKKIYNEIDYNFDNTVSFEEFINFVFPNDVAITSSALAHDGLKPTQQTSSKMPIDI